MNEQAALSAQWHSLARRTARKVNLGWALQWLGPVLAVTSIAAFAVLLFLRTRGFHPLPARDWPWVLVLPALALSAFYFSRQRFITPAQAMVRLESQLHLHNALSVAHAGQGLWPPVPARAKDGLHWRWFHLVAPWAACAASLALALWLPISQASQPGLPTMEPQAWQQMDQWLKTLEEEKLIAPEEKEEQAAKIAELRDQPQDKWFSHDSLHAGDTLKEQLQRDMARMAQNMKQAERSLNALQNYSDQLSQAAKDQVIKDLDEALSALKESGLELNPELLKELAQIDPKNLPSLSKEQLDQMREALKKGGEKAGEMAQSPGFLGDGEGEDDELAEMLGDMRGKGLPGNGQEGPEPGEGDITRGPGTAPLTLAQEEDDFGTDKNESLPQTDLSRAQLGAQLGIKDGKHEVDKTYQGPTSAGKATHQGQGGEQVWRETLTPEEKAVLKKVFR